MYEEDLSRQRKFFESYDIKDPKSVQKWLADYSFLSVSDLARMSGKSITWVRYKRREFGLNTGTMPPVLPKKSGPTKALKLIAPADWRTKDWLQQALLKYLPIEIAEAVGVKIYTIKNLAFKWKLERPGLKVQQLRNPYFTYAWCYEHYINRGWSQRACSKVAGVSQQTFSNWLLALNIPVRYATSRSRSVPVEIWVTQLVDKLRKLECVRKVFLRKDHIHVRYKNFFWESYFFRGDVLFKNQIQYSYWIDCYDGKLDNIPALEFKYRQMDGDDFPGHLHINNQSFERSSFLEKRVAIHDFAWQMCRRGFVWPKFPPDIIKADYDLAYNTDEYENSGSLCKKPPSYFRNHCCPGFLTLMHFFGFRELWDGFISSPRKCIMSVNAAVKAKLEINTVNLIRYMTRKYKTPVVELGVGMYVRLFEKLHLSGTMLDLCPGFGYKAMACAILGIKYRAIKNEYSCQLEKAIGEGFADFIGLDFEWYEGQQANILMCDDDLKGCDFAIAKPHIQQGMSVVFFAKDRYNFERAGAQPISIVPITQHVMNQPVGYFFVL